MPRNKDLKRLVRARMSKTGESYTAARAKIVARTGAKTRSGATTVHTPSAQQRPDYGALAGMADATIEGKTGRNWEQWVRALDGDGAASMAHRDIAALVSGKYEVGPWWSQMVTVGYERIKGLRARGQRRDGSYEASKSRTYNVPLATLFTAWADARRRRRWLDGKVGKVRTVTPMKSMRLDGQDRSIVVIGFMSKGTAKSAVAVQHTKLRDPGAAKQVRQYWAERLDALGALLESRG